MLYFGAWTLNLWNSFFVDKKPKMGSLLLLLVCIRIGNIKHTIRPTVEKKIQNALSVFFVLFFSFCLLFWGVEDFFSSIMLKYDTLLSIEALFRFCIDTYFSTFFADRYWILILLEYYLRVEPIKQPFNRSIHQSEYCCTFSPISSNCRFRSHQDPANLKDVYNLWY